jgi:membrane protein implicated in regulation of membrane protease activity
MTYSSPLPSDAEASPGDLPPEDRVHWVDATDENPTFPEGAWSDHQAEVVDVLQPGMRYQIKYEGAYWTGQPATAEASFSRGQIVAVLGREGNELIINALPSA